MCKYIFSLATILILFLFNSELFSHGLGNYFDLGIKGEYYNEYANNGINLNVAFIPRVNYIENHININDFLLFGVNFNDYSNKIRANFTLLNIKGFDIDTIKGINFFSDFSMLSFKHSIQLNSEITWLKYAPGIGYGKKINSESAIFLGINSGLEVYSAYLSDKVSTFSDKDFDGVSFSTSATFYYSSGYYILIFSNDVKAFLWEDKKFYSNSTAFEVSFNLNKLFSKHYDISQLLLNFGIKNSILYYDSNSNKSLIFYINFFKTILY